jgi:hypothetical protein
VVAWVVHCGMEDLGFSGFRSCIFPLATEATAEMETPSSVRMIRSVLHLLQGRGCGSWGLGFSV